MKLLTVTAIPLITVMVLGEAFTSAYHYEYLASAKAASDIEAVESLPGIFKVPAGSFDEMMWNAIENTAKLEDKLPANVKDFRLTMPESGGSQPVVLAFDRSDLRRLKKGRITPEEFVRNCVDFQ